MTWTGGGHSGEQREADINEQYSEDRIQCNFLPAGTLPSFSILKHLIKVLPPEGVFNHASPQVSLSTLTSSPPNVGHSWSHFMPHCLNLWCSYGMSHLQ